MKGSVVFGRDRRARLRARDGRSGTARDAHHGGETMRRIVALAAASVLVLAACGVVFELPIAVLGLVRVGALSSAKLRRNRRLGYLIVVALGVALPGVDPFTTALETVPLLVLFEASIWLSVVFEGRWRAARLAEGA